MPNTSYNPSPEMDVREAGGWAQYPRHYPRKVHDRDIAQSPDNDARTLKHRQKKEPGRPNATGRAGPAAPERVPAAAFPWAGTEA